MRPRRVKLVVGAIMCTALVAAYFFIIFIHRPVIACSFAEWKRLMEEKQLTGMVVIPLRQAPHKASPTEVEQFILQFENATTLEFKEYDGLLNAEIERVGKDGVGGRHLDIEWIFHERTLKSDCRIFNFGLSFGCVQTTLLVFDEVSGSDPVKFPVPAWLFKAANN